MSAFSAKSSPTVVFVTFPNAKLLDVSGPMQVFTDAKRVGGKEYDVHLLSSEGGYQPTDTAVPLQTNAMDQWGDDSIDTLLIAGGLGARAAAEEPRMLSGVQKLAGQSSRIGSVCTGAYILAAAGLLDGRRAVTHWVFCQDLAEKHPDVSVEPDRIFIKDKVWTSAGVTTGIDMALAMVAEDSGRTVALDLARSLVTYMARPGGQSQFSTALHSQSNDVEGRFDDLHAWINQNLGQEMKVDRLAEHVGMSARNFARVYQATMGLTPAKAVEHYRVAAARDLLEQTSEPINTIASKVGFRDTDRMRRAMHRVLGVSPKESRDRFGG